MLSVKNLSYSYDGKSTISFPNIEVLEGETLLVLGDSGRGKTTLLHLLGGIISPQKGEIFLKGINFGELRNKKLDKFRSENIGIIFQEAHFIRSISVIENVKFAAQFAGKNIDDIKASSFLEKVGLREKANMNTSRLSQGEKQRLNILRAIVTRPNLILADEPTSALDDNNCSRVISLLQELKNEVNASLIIVTHDQRLKEKFENKILLS